MVEAEYAETHHIAGKHYSIDVFNQANYPAAIPAWIRPQRHQMPTGDSYVCLLYGLVQVDICYA